MNFARRLAAPVPVDENELAAILAEAIRFCSDEVETVECFEAESRGPDGVGETL